jgi:hypothetical protein
VGGAVARTVQYCGRFKSSGSFAMLSASRVDTIPSQPNALVAAVEHERDEQQVHDDDNDADSYGDIGEHCGPPGNAPRVVPRRYPNRGKNSTRKRRDLGVDRAEAYQPYVAGQAHLPGQI